MGSIDPIVEAQIWLQTTLSASPAITTAFGTRVYAHPDAPRTVDYPICTYACLTPHQNLMVVGADVLWFELRFVVRGIQAGADAYTLRDGSVAIYDALHKKFGQTSVASVVSCVQERPFYMPEIIASSEYIHLGGVYLIQIRPLS